MLILGSESPRRLELLKRVGIKIDKVVAPKICEEVRNGELPRDYVLRVAITKNSTVLAALEDFLITADTAVIKGRRILGKPDNAIEAKTFLRLLSGARHKVISAVCISHNTKVRTRIVETVIKFKNLSEKEIDSYIQSNEWQGKAGGYAIQGRAEAFIPFISGSYSNVVGLPLLETLNLLQGMGYKSNDAETTN